MSMEYERAVGGAVPAAADGAAPPPSAAAAQPQRMMSFGTVTLKMTDGKTGAERDANVAEMLLVRGLANVARHRMCADWLRESVSNFRWYARRFACRLWQCDACCCKG